MYKSEGLSVYVGDFFKMSQAQIGKVDGVYDRAALVAFPRDLRRLYSQHLAYITQFCSQLMICFDYSQELFNGPPFSVNKDELIELYDDNFSIEPLYFEKVKEGFRNQLEVYEAVYLLK